MYQKRFETKNYFLHFRTWQYPCSPFYWFRFYKLKHGFLFEWYKTSTISGKKNHAQ